VFLASHEEWEGDGVEVVSAALPLSTYGFRVDGILDAVFPVRAID
jgi:hypothetical protein